MIFQQVLHPARKEGILKQKGGFLMTYDEIRGDHAVNVYIAQADASLHALGFTEHSFAHVTKVAETAGTILKHLGHSERRRHPRGCQGGSDYSVRS